MVTATEILSLILFLAVSFPTVATLSFITSCSRWDEKGCHVSLLASTSTSAPSETDHTSMNGRKDFFAVGGSAATWGIIAFGSSTAWSYPAPSRLKLQEARDQLDLVVQACSVQAWTDAYDLVSDSTLDNLASMMPKNEAEPILGGIQTLRQRLSGVTFLPTQDAIAIMSVGTQTRSALEKYIQKSES